MLDNPQSRGLLAQDQILPFLVNRRKERLRMTEKETIYQEDKMTDMKKMMLVSQDLSRM